LHKPDFQPTNFPPKNTKSSNLKRTKMIFIPRKSRKNSERKVTEKDNTKHSGQYRAKLKTNLSSLSTIACARACKVMCFKHRHANTHTPHTHLQIYTYTHAQTNTLKYVHMYTHKLIQTHTYKHTHTNTHIQTHTYKHTHTDTRTRNHLHT